jgi:hypothetical protein
MGHEIAGHEREEIGGFGPRVVPFGPALAAGGGVAVRQEHGQVAFDADLERGHDVGAVGIEVDLAEPLGLALGAEHDAFALLTFASGAFAT